jgi:hypothetical protein
MLSRFSKDARIMLLTAFASFILGSALFAYFLWVPSLRVVSAGIYYCLFAFGINTMILAKMLMDNEFKKVWKTAMLALMNIPVFVVYFFVVWKYLQQID